MQAKVCCDNTKKQKSLLSKLTYDLSFGVSQKSPAWFSLMNSSLLYRVLLVIFENFHDLYYKIYQYLTVHQNIHI